MVGHDEHALFNPKTIRRLSANVSIDRVQKAAVDEWLSLLLENKLEEEKTNYPLFMRISSSRRTIGEAVLTNYVPSRRRYCVEDRERGRTGFAGGM